MCPMQAIKALREKLKLSQRELGEVIGVGQTAISNYEVGERTPDIDVALKIRDYASKRGMKIDLEKLLTRSPRTRSEAA